jgi:uncharacterized membrane protein
MPRIFARPIGLACLLLFLTSIPIVTAALKIYEIPTGQLPPDAAKFAPVQWSMFLHALGGLLFGLLGPIQFAGVLKRRFGRLHRVTGRVFVMAGLLLGLSSLRLLAEFPDASTWVLVSARLLAGLAVAVSLILAVVAIRRRDVTRHKAWMIRAYAIGMGPATISFIMFPIFLTTGEPPEGYAADFLFVASWIINITIAELVVRRTGAVTVKPLSLTAPILSMPTPRR